jgi:hypothetical protein
LGGVRRLLFLEFANSNRTNFFAPNTAVPPVGVLPLGTPLGAIPPHILGNQMVFRAWYRGLTPRLTDVGELTIIPSSTMYATLYEYPRAGIASRLPCVSTLTEFRIVVEIPYTTGLPTNIFSAEDQFLLRVFGVLLGCEDRYIQNQNTAPSRLRDLRCVLKVSAPADVVMLSAAHATLNTMRASWELALIGPMFSVGVLNSVLWFDISIMGFGWRRSWQYHRGPPYVNSNWRGRRRF